MGRQFPDVSAKHGAPMGRRHAKELSEEGKIRLFRVRLVDGDYDDGGAYWGGPPSPPLYCARDEDGNEQFVRARSRTAAAKELEIDPDRLARPLPAGHVIDRAEKLGEFKTEIIEQK